MLDRTNFMIVMALVLATLFVALRPGYLISASCTGATILA
jgi:hypothetical protein